MNPAALARVGSANAARNTPTWQGVPAHDRHPALARVGSANAAPSPLIRPIAYGIVHCSDSLYGDIDEITVWHKQRGFRTIGYHYVIGGRFPTWLDWKRGIPHEDHIGRILVGRPVDEPGAHCLYHNDVSVGYCLVGKTAFHPEQFAALAALHQAIAPGTPLYAHCELNPRKTCPNIQPELLRAYARTLAPDLKKLAALPANTETRQ